MTALTRLALSARRLTTTAGGHYGADELAEMVFSAGANDAAGARITRALSFRRHRSGKSTAASSNIPVLLCSPDGVLPTLVASHNMQGRTKKAASVLGPTQVTPGR